VFVIDKDTKQVVLSLNNKNPELMLPGGGR